MRSLLATDESDILARIVSPLESKLTKLDAKSLLALKFSKLDHQRMEELCTKNGQGKLSAAEKREMNRYERIGLLLDLLHSKARLAIKRRSMSAQR